VKPRIVVVGLNFEDARRYILANRDARPILKDAVVVSCSGATSHHNLNAAKVIETPGAKLGRDYFQVMAHLRISAARYRAQAPLT
jgi:hypothetical protein